MFDKYIVTQSTCPNQEAKRLAGRKGKCRKISFKTKRGKKVKFKACK